MGYLEQYAGTVAGLVVSTFRPSVLHVFEHLQGSVHQFVALVAVNVDNHAHTTSVVLIVGAVESLVKSFVFLHLGFCKHAFPLVPEACKRLLDFRPGENAGLDIHTNCLCQTASVGDKRRRCTGRAGKGLLKPTTGLGLRDANLSAGSLPNICMTSV